jgi:hypothetical protein
VDLGQGCGFSDDFGGVDDLGLPFPARRRQERGAKSHSATAVIKILKRFLPKSPNIAQMDYACENNRPQAYLRIELASRLWYGQDIYSSLHGEL